MTVNVAFWRERRVFVTGATGLLGGWLTKSLYESGASLVCLVRNQEHTGGLVSPAHGLIKQVATARGRVEDHDSLERILGEYEIDTVFHIAAQAIVASATRDPVPTFETNVRGTWNVLEACRRSPRVRAVVLASSDKAYGEHEVLPYTENMPLQARQPYEVSKSCADLIAQAYAHSYDLPVAITRCGNFFGGGDLNWNRVVPGTIRSVICGERPVIRSDGRFVRDYFYIEDAAAAYMLLAERLTCNPELKGQAFNFSNENQTNVLDLVSLIVRKMDSDLIPEVQNQANKEIRNQYLSSERARRVLGWAPTFTLEEGLQRTIAWYRRFLKQHECSSGHGTH